MTNWDDETYDENLYQDDANYDQVEDGEISPEEAAFMQGYEEADEIDSSAKKAEDDEE